MCDILKPKYISAGCNRSPRSLDWGGNESQIVYAFSHSVALMSNQEPYQVVATFNKHKGHINALKWVSNTNNERLHFNEFVTCSTDKSLVVWRGNGQEVKFRTKFIAFYSI